MSASKKRPRLFVVLFIALGLATVATAADRTWIGGNNDWDGTNGNWSSNDEPDSNDVAIFNTSNSVDLANPSEVVAGLTMSGGSRLDTNDNFLNVDGLVQLGDDGTRLTVGGSSSILLANAITINSGALLRLVGGSVGLNGNAGTGVLDVNAGGSVAGNGLIYYPAAANGVQVLDLDGTLTATTIYLNPLTADLTNSAASTLTVSVSNPAAVIDLDGNSGNSTINVNRNDTLLLNGGVLDTAYSGTMNLGSGATFSRDVAWSFDGTLNTVVGSTLGSFTAPATIAGVGSFTQTGGSINIDAGETLQISSSTFTATNGTINNSGLIIFDSDTTDISGITFNMTGPTASLTVNPGDDVFIVSNDLELDGAGTATNVVTINSGGKLDLSLSGSADESFTGTINLNAGTLEVTTSDNDWSLAGTVNVGANLPTSVIDGEEVTYSANTTISANTALAFNAQVVYDGSPTIAGSGLLIHNSAAAVDGTPSIEVGIFRANAPVTINPGATLLLNVGNINDPSDEHRNTFEINSGTLDVTVADGEWQLGTVGGASGTILFRQSSITPTLEGASTLRVTQGTLDVDGGATIFVPIILEQTSSNYGTLRFVGDGGLVGLAGHLQLRGGDIHDITDDPAIDTQLQLIGGLTVSGPAASGVFVDTFRWDLSPTTIEPDAYFGVYADNIEATGPQTYDNLITINQGTLHVDLGNYARWIMNGYLDLDRATVGGLNEVTPGGDAIEVGDDAGTYATLNVAPGTSTINSFVQFNSDAYVYLESGAELVMNGGVYFSPVNGANNGVFTGGAGTWLFLGPVTFGEATTIYMPEAYLALGAPGGSNNAIVAPVTMSLETMGNFNGLMTISAPGRLTVNLTDPNDEWTIGTTATINCLGASPSDIFLAGSDINHNGTMNIYGEGQIAARLDIGSLGEINIIDADGSLTLSGGSLADPNTISGGEINGPGTLTVASDTALTGFGSIYAPIDVSFGAELRADGGILNIFGPVDGFLSYIGTADADGTLNFANPVTISTLIGVDLRDGPMTGADVVNNGVIQGSGLVAVSQLINDGRISAVNGGTLVLDRAGTPFGYDWDGLTGDGQLSSYQGNLTLRAVGFVPFSGTIHMSLDIDVILFEGLGFFNTVDSTIYLGGSTYRSDVQHLFGGTLTAGNNSLSEIDVPNGRFLSGSITYLDVGDLQFRKSMTIEGGATFTGTRTLINLNGATLTIQNGAMVDVPIVNQGTLVLGASPGQITLPSYTQSETGILEIELGGTGPDDIDRLIVTGAASLAGTLNLSLINGFVPSGGETFDFLSVAGGITGAFDMINLPSLPLGLSWGLNDDDPTMFQLSVVQGLPGDYNEDGAINAADYTVWRDRLGGGTSLPNDDTTGVGPDDYDRWSMHFGENAAAGSIQPDAVPEPSDLQLLILAATVVCLGVRRAGRQLSRTH